MENNKVILLQDNNEYTPFAVCRNIDTAKLLIEKGGEFISHRDIQSVDYWEEEKTFLVKSINPNKPHRGVYETTVSVCEMPLS